MIRLDNIPRVILPFAFVRGGQFIQFYILDEFYNRKQPFFRMGSRDADESDLLGKILNKFKIPYQLIDVVGGGNVDGNGRDFVVYGKSKIHPNLSTDYTHLEKLSPYIPPGKTIRMMGEGGL